MNDPHVSRVHLGKECERIVGIDGRIMDETEYWSVTWTESQAGWADMDYRQYFVNYGEARNRADVLASRRKPEAAIEDVLTEEDA